MTGQDIEFETFEHVADIGVRGKGRTIEEAFAGGAMAMTTVMFNLDKIKAEVPVDIECSGYDIESLFVEFLNMILTKKDLEEMVFSRFDVNIDISHPEEPVLKGRIWGERYDKARHEPRTEVKAATYSQLKVYKEDGLHIAQCIVDV